MSALILLAVLVVVVPPLAWLARRKLQRERFRWHMRRMTASFDEMARVIGEAFIPAVEKATQAFKGLAAAFSAPTTPEDGKGATNE